MHNFIGSADALNYKDGYWDLRKETIGVKVGGKRVLPVTAAEPARRRQAATSTRSTAACTSTQYSSIMDYGARVNSDNRGIGKYDDAAILFAYSGGVRAGLGRGLQPDPHRLPQPEHHRADSTTWPSDFTVRGAHVEIPLAQVEHYTPVSHFYYRQVPLHDAALHFADQTGDLRRRPRCSTRASRA